MNINHDPRDLDDEDLCAFLADLHALRWHEIHPSNRDMVERLREHARAELARRVFVPWWNPPHDDKSDMEHFWLGVPGHPRRDSLT